MPSPYSFAQLQKAIANAIDGDTFSISGVDVQSDAISALLTAFLGKDLLSLITGQPPVTNGPSITVSGSMSADVFGEATLGASATFTVPKDTAEVVIIANWKVTGTSTLDLNSLLNALGLTPATLPSTLDLELQSAVFIYDSAAGVYAVAAKTETFGTLNFVAQIATNTAPALYAIGLQADTEIDLTDLPLIGSKLEDLASINVDDFEIFAANQPLATGGPAADTLLTQYQPDLSTFGILSFPSLPEAATTTAVFSATLNVGSLTKPLILALDNRTLKTQGRALALAGAPAADTTIWYPIQQSFGPVSLQRVGVRYAAANEFVWFELDASLAAGPLTLSLTGLAVGTAINDFAPSFTIDGIAVDYANPPLQIAGSLVNLNPGGDGLSFSGGLVVGTGDFTIDAVGYYGNVSGFPSMFVFGEVSEPLGGPPAFFVTGVAAGFGYNSNVTLPSVDAVGSFPLVAALTGGTPGFNAGSSALEVLQKLVSDSPPWVNAEADELWLAAGVTFTSFKLVNSQALLVVEAGNELVISLLGQSQAQFPQAGTDQPTYAQIGMELDAKFQPNLGEFSVQAVLSPSSYVLDPACLVTGGFAFFVWSGSNPHAGDFVLSLGGYHPSFAPPSYYPQLPRLQFHWSLDGSVTVQGDSYFALTPSMLMFGGSLSVTYQSGNLKAWLTAGADVLIGWTPFQYDAKISLSVGASYKLDLLFTSTTLSVELGCTLEIMGPPTHGSVTVDWWVISFTIDFGNWDQPTLPAADWSNVQAVLPNTGSAANPNVVLIQATEGLTNTGSAGGQTARRLGAAGGDAPSPWVVRGSSFNFVTSSHVPATSYQAGNHNGGSGSFNVAPLAWSDVTASHVVTIRSVDPTDPFEYSNHFAVTATTGNVPASLWGDLPTDPNGSPQIPPADGQLVADQITGLQFLVNAPTVQGNTNSVAQSNLQVDPLGLPGAIMPLATAAPPAGDVASLDSGSIGKISNPQTGIAADPVAKKRAAIFAELATLNYGVPANDDLTGFATLIAGGALADAPLFVA